MGTVLVLEGQLGIEGPDFLREQAVAVSGSAGSDAPEPTARWRGVGAGEQYVRWVGGPSHRAVNGPYRGPVHSAQCLHRFANLL